MQFKTLSMGLVGLLSMGLAASAQPVDQSVDNTASNVDKLSHTTKWSPNEPAWFSITDSPGVAVRDLSVRAPDWTSPHVRRAFAVGLGSQLVTGANWVFEMWVNHDHSFRLWRSEVSGSTNLFQANVVVPAINTIATSVYEWTGQAAFQMTGWVGDAELVIDFVAEVVASSTSCYILKMLKYPTAKLAGASIPVTSWTFNSQEA
ncbi:hypothetical protein E4U54_002002 [Claviceps lovelessii]|nr:hypothetical protein E4U54_002002 [Claviceps lovelessii]